MKINMAQISFLLSIGIIFDIPCFIKEDFNRGCRKGKSCPASTYRRYKHPAFGIVLKPIDDFCAFLGFDLACNHYRTEF